MNAEQNAREAMEVLRSAVHAYGGELIPGENEDRAASVTAAKLAEKDAALENAITVAGQPVQALDTERAAHEATKAECIEWSKAFRDEAERRKQSEAELQAMREALEPFQTFAECHIDEEGWTGPMKTTRIVDWFGPSDFRALTRKDA